jgi:isopropylmalate/homocitrate/citramalate synthase
MNSRENDIAPPSSAAVNRRYGAAVPRDVLLWDETLRDGEQSPGVAFTIEQKVAIAQQLDAFGVDVIGAGFPAVSEDERQAIREIVRLGLHARIGATVRAAREDVERALQLGVREAHMFLPASKLHLNHKMGLDERAALVLARRCVEDATRSGLRVCFIAEDSTRARDEFLLELFQCAVDAGADSIMVTDTVGVMTPTAMNGFVREIAGRLRDAVPLGVHCHDDFGLATANTLAAFEAGATYLTGTINGIGERAGNAAIEELALSLKVLYGIETAVNLERLAELSQLVERSSGMVKAPNKAIVGFNAFRHESGIHTAAMLRHTQTYEPYSPATVGAQRSFILGKHAGRAALQHVLGKHNLRADDCTLDRLIHELKQRALSRDGSSASEQEFSHDRIRGVSEEWVLARYMEIQREEIAS